MRLEITAHRIGGETFPGDDYRKFGPLEVALAPSAIEQVDIDATNSVRFYIRARFADWHPVDDEWLAGRVDLSDMNGAPLGMRPVMVYNRPYDVPTHTLFLPRWPEFGAISLGLRRVE